MNTPPTSEQIRIYKSLFRGRDDVFAVRWEKADGSASGYSPVCANEWKPGVCLKLQKGKCRDCTQQNYIPMSDQHIRIHLQGQDSYGIYPLLPDNTSYFLAADFDGVNWQEEAIAFMDVCELNGLLSYLERSRSGNGGHVWLFFDDKYPASKSRKIVLSLLQECGIVNEFDKAESFDRLFPNQDVLSGKGFGNLICLPLSGQARKQNNTEFLNKHTLQSYKDQWSLLKTAERITPSSLDWLYNKFTSTRYSIPNTNVNVQIILKEQVFIHNENLPSALIAFLREQLNFANTEYFVKKQMGLSTHNIERYFRLIDTKDDCLAIPSGFLSRLLSFLAENDIHVEIKDERVVSYSETISIEVKLYPFQQKALDALLSYDNGILVAPPGSGKTLIGLALIAQRKQSTLILVHRKQIYNQWLERIEGFLNIRKQDIGQFSATKKLYGEAITVAMVQSLIRIEDIEKLAGRTGMIIVDECHHMPAKMFRAVMSRFAPRYRYGLTATPERKYNDDKLIFYYLGDTVHTIEQSERNVAFVKDRNTEKGEGKYSISIKETSIEVPFKLQTDNLHVLSKILIFSTERNNQIVQDIRSVVDTGRSCLVLTERKEHIEVLSFYLKRDYEIIALTGDLSENQRHLKIEEIKAGDFQILLATGQLIGEGTDFIDLDCLFLGYPFSFSGKLTQYIGRLRKLENKTIYDYRDRHIPYYDKMFKQRLRYYKRYGYDIKM
ncbi:DEAD/DEAH box helicase [candidate division KSB1 bacterium]|nr:DEAD/DEAH box helicase [candidate division KSB1 bacterium]